jgi:hypothetical protein
MLAKSDPEWKMDFSDIDIIRSHVVSGIYEKKNNNYSSSGYSVNNTISSACR